MKTFTRIFLGSLFLGFFTFMTIGCSGSDNKPQAMTIVLNRPPMVLVNGDVMYNGNRYSKDEWAKINKIVKY